MSMKYAVELVITCRVINNGVNESLNLVGMLPSTLLLDKRTIQLFSTTFLSTFKVLFEKSWLTTSKSCYMLLLLCRYILHSSKSKMIKTLGCIRIQPFSGPFHKQLWLDNTKKHKIRDTKTFLCLPFARKLWIF